MPWTCNAEIRQTMLFGTRDRERVILVAATSARRQRPRPIRSIRPERMRAGSRSRATASWLGRSSPVTRSVACVRVMPAQCANALTPRRIIPAHLMSLPTFCATARSSSSPQPPSPGHLRSSRYPRRSPPAAGASSGRSQRRTPSGFGTIGVYLAGRRLSHCCHRQFVVAHKRPRGASLRADFMILSEGSLRCCLQRGKPRAV
jgi:hypothetical protein